MLLRPRAAIPIVHFGAASTSTPIASPFKSALWSARAYSSEAAAVEEPVRASTEVSNFADLADLGVHPSLITAVTKHMGYQTMTPVQSKTISPAMKGTDM
jgi:ATP-dependent RNA helicase MSS116